MNLKPLTQRKVLVVGSANVDFVARVPRLPQAGESLRGESLTVVWGGKGANQAVALARLGADVQFVCCVGYDQYGRQMKNSFKKEGIPTRYIKETQDTLTGTALIFVDDRGQNSIIVIAGANHCLLPEDIIKHESLFKRSEVFLTQLELLPETIETALIQAKRHGLVTIVDAGPPRPLRKEIFPFIDVLSPNETETEFLVGKSPRTKKDWRECVQRLMDYGTRAVVLKLGSKGSYYYDGETELFTPSFPIHAVDTTAAGDAFTSALALGWGKMDLASLLRFANSAGALACTKFGAQPSMPTLSEVNAFLRRQNG